MLVIPTVNLAARERPFLFEPRTLQARYGKTLARRGRELALSFLLM